MTEKGRPVIPNPNDAFIRETALGGAGRIMQKVGGKLRRGRIGQIPDEWDRKLLGAAVLVLNYYAGTFTKQPAGLQYALLVCMRN